MRVPASGKLSCLFAVVMAAILPARVHATDASLPYFSQQPGDKLTTIGSSLVFVPTVSSPSALKYQWLFNGAAIIDETNLNLVISECGRAHSGWYVLQANNDAGQVASRPAFLTVEGTPAGTVQFRNTTQNRVTASAGGYATATSVQLFAGPTPERVRLTGVFATVNNGLFVGDTVPVPAIAPNETVFVRAELTDGQRSNLIHVRSGNGFVGGTLEDLRFPILPGWPSPTIESHPRDMEVNLGERMLLKVDLIDYSVVTVRWIKDGNPTPVFEDVLQLSSLSNIAGSSRFEIPEVSLADAGNYKAVLISDYAGTIEVSESANIKVVIPTRGHINSIKIIGGFLQIEAGGRPNRVYTLEFRPDGHGWFSLFAQSSPTGRFTFPNLSPPDKPSWFRLRSSN